MIAREIPDDLLLTETDNPGGLEWLIGTPGVPAVIEEDVVAALADVRETTGGDIARTVERNFLRLIDGDPRLASALTALGDGPQRGTAARGAAAGSGGTWSSGASWRSVANGSRSATCSCSLTTPTLGRSGRRSDGPTAAISASSRGSPSTTRTIRDTEQPLRAGRDRADTLADTVPLAWTGRDRVNTFAQRS